MTTIDLFTIVGACAAVVAAWATIINSKGCLLHRIERKEEQVRLIDNRMVNLYGLNGRAMYPETALDKKKVRLLKQIEKLKKRL